ncbi:ferredoxin [Blastococcus sp. CT_GayMR16]|uniref:ferredoxin n=1 Tax=Blastococcus sp. CT_GayMR16 TaxID=2559607 RepID=UPI001073354D|nr:ferredoxin [Blastococcus sp. CT_GayMR16]TFV88880.1 ferredoxin [Blastococcus sp. CT_GayMR16]
MKVAIDQGRCQGHGRCYELAPEVFTDDDSGYGTVIAPDVPPAYADQAQDAVNVCPERAISTAE